MRQAASQESYARRCRRPGGGNACWQAWASRRSTVPVPGWFPGSAESAPGGLAADSVRVQRVPARIEPLHAAGLASGPAPGRPGRSGLRAPRCGRNHRPGPRQFSTNLRLDAPAGARPQAGRAGLVCRRRLHEPADRNPRPQSRTSWDQKRLTWCRNNARQLETGTLARRGRAVLACGRPGGSCPRSARTGRPLAAIRWPGAAGARSLPPPRGCQARWPVPGDSPGS